MNPLVRFSIKHPRWVISTALLAILAVSPGLWRLQLRTDGNALLPTSAAEVKYDRSIRRAFGINDQLIVLVQADHPDGIFNVHTLDLVLDLTRLIGDLPDIELDDITSLATERSDRVVPGTLRFRAFLEPPPRSQADLKRIRDDLRQIRLYIGTLVSYDESSTCILVGVADDADRADLYRRILRIITDLGEIPETVEVVGAPVAEALLGTHILEDLGVPSQLIGQHFIRSDAKDSSAAPQPIVRLRTWIGAHIGLLPMAIVAMFLVFLVTFRSLSAAMLPLMEVGACLIFVFSLMGWSHTPIYLTMAVLPVILTAMGIADEVHIFIRYRQLLHEQHEDRHVISVGTAMSEMWRPVVKTSITTAICFLSFSLSPLRPVQAFGVFTAIGIVFCMFWSLTIIPASLVLIPSRWFLPLLRRTSRDSRDNLERWFERIGGAIRRRPILVLIVAIAVIALTPFGLIRLFVQDSWIDGFSKDSAFYQATEKVNAGFRGTHILVVEADAGGSVLSGTVDAKAVELHRIKLPEDAVVDPAVLGGQWLSLELLQTQVPNRRQARRINTQSRRLVMIEEASITDGHLVITTSRHSVLRMARRGNDSMKLRYSISPHGLLNRKILERLCGLEDFIERRSDDAVGGVLGPCSYLSTLNYTTHARKEAFRNIPTRSERILWLWYQYERVRGSARLRQVIDEDHARCLLTVFMKNANYQLTGKLMSAIREYERENLNPHGITLGFAGDVAVSQAMIGAIVGTQMRSLLLSIVGIFIVASVFGRSLHWGLYCVLPCGLAVLTNFAIMGGLGIPLGVATSMFAAMTLGIGVDYAIHFIDRYRMSQSHDRGACEVAIRALVMTGPAILIDAMAIALGFGILVLSQVPANTRLGGLVVLSVLSSFIWTIVLLPALIALWPPRKK